MSTSLIGQTIGRYKIVDHLGKGGMAEVYKGLQESLDRYVAIKLMHNFLVTEEDFLKRFQREAKAMASMSHPHIVRVFDFDVYGDNGYYLVMEFVDGGTLKEYLEDFNSRGEKLPMQDAVRICTEIADALAYAHRRQMVHRDIKPANVMLDSETGKAILTDFGIVKMVGNQSMAYTATGALIGTPAYMSPEQALGKPGDERVDIYSLGVMIFQMVTGQLPFDAQTPLAVVMKHVNDLPPLPMEFNEDVPLDLQEVILKALAKDPNDRYQTAKELADALRSVDFSGPLATSAVSMPSTTPSSLTFKNLVVPQNTLTGARLAEETAAQESQKVETAAFQLAPDSTSSRKRPGWLIPTIVGIVAVVAMGLFFVFSEYGFGKQGTSTPDAIVVVPDEPTDTPEPSEPTAVPTETNTSLPTLDPFDIARTVSAENALTREADFTATPIKTATPTITPSPSPTVDGTAEFFQNCSLDADFVSVNRSGFNSNFVPVDSSFSLTFILKNSGTCPWDSGLIWHYFEGDDLGFEEGDAVEIGQTINADEEVELTSRLGPVSGPDEFNSTWQLIDENGEQIGDLVTFEVRSFIPATATPIATDTPEETPTSTVGDDWRANWAFDVSFCEYTDNINWRCTVTIYPYIDGTGAQGVNGEFTVSVFDQPGGQAATYRGVGPFEHQVIFRRCHIYNSEIRVVDDVTATEASNRVLSVDPNQYFEGGCTE